MYCQAMAEGILRKYMYRMGLSMDDLIGDDRKPRFHCTGRQWLRVSPEMHVQDGTEHG